MYITFQIRIYIHNLWERSNYVYKLCERSQTYDITFQIKNIHT
jgi:hypothetical protein